MKKLLTAFVVVALTTGPALAFQCPLLVKQVEHEADTLLAAFYIDIGDERPNTAKAIAAEGMRSHEADKHDEAMAKMKEAASLIGLALQFR